MVLLGVQQMQFFVYKLSLPTLFAEPATPFMCVWAVDVAQRVNSLAPSAPCVCVLNGKGWNNGYDRPSARPSTPFHFYSLWTYLYGKPEVTASVRTDRTQHVSVVWKVHEKVQWIALCFVFQTLHAALHACHLFPCFPTALGAYNFVLPV